MARASPPNVKIARLVALGLDHLPNILRHTPIRFMSSRVAPVSRIRSWDQVAVTQAPMIPAKRAHLPADRPREEPTITSDRPTLHLETDRAGHVFFALRRICVFI